MTKILDVYWFNNGGIVRVQTEDEGIKYYIRSIDSGRNESEQEDAQFIADWGNTFPTDAGEVLFGLCTAVNKYRNG